MQTEDVSIVGIVETDSKAIARYQKRYKLHDSLFFTSYEDLYNKAIPEAVSVFPKAHTCFNRIDLPLYESKKKLTKFLTMAIQMEATGFDID